ncbi:MAG: hypothetical protein ACTS46_00615 [Candidatus Hodgkinia cicadicola]
MKWNVERIDLAENFVEMNFNAFALSSNETIEQWFELPAEVLPSEKLFISIWLAKCRVGFINFDWRFVANEVQFRSGWELLKRSFANCWFSKRWSFISMKGQINVEEAVGRFKEFVEVLFISWVVVSFDLNI